MCFYKIKDHIVDRTVYNQMGDAIYVSGGKVNEYGHMFPDGVNISIFDDVCNQVYETMEHYQVNNYAVYFHCDNDKIFHWKALVEV